jgi:ABC-2 type transport system permease protein
VGALGQPIVFWLLIGAGFQNVFRQHGAAENVDYLEYFFPGVLAMMILFTAIFSTISVVEDRRERFLQGVLAAPVPRSAVVLCQALGGTSLALIQGILLLALSPLAGIPLTLRGVAALAAAMILLAFALTNLGLLIAWRMDSTQGFHSIMNLILIPLWVLSGAVFPATSAHPWLEAFMGINPFAYGVAALRHIMYLERPELAGEIPGLGLSLIVTVLFGAAAFLAASLVARRSGG